MMAIEGDPRIGPFTCEIPLADLAATQALARNLAPALRIGDVVALRGALGAGKTAFARAVIQFFLPDEEVPSPTFTLVQTYDTAQFTIVHADLYRLESPHDVWELGWDDVVHEAVVLVEWPERLGPDLTPRNRLEISFDVESEGQLSEGERRVARLSGFGTFAARLARIGGQP